MKKGTIVIALVLLSAVMGGYLIFSKKEEKEKFPEIAKSEQAIPTTIQSDIPSITLTKQDGSTIVANKIQGKSVFVLFLPDCDHCQREAVQIRDNMQAFKDYSIYFVSSAPFTELTKFEQEYKLGNLAQVQFMQATVRDILVYYGAIPTPSVFIYSDKGRLVKDFKGETAIEQIMQFL
jgi:peroxiredoxin